LPTRTVSDLGERALIQRITARLAIPDWVVVGPGDDAAVAEPLRGALEVFTTDVQVAGVHFDERFVPPDAIGHRALAVNLSDLAAMGARPRGALLSLVVPDALEVTAIDGLLDGFLGLASTHRVAVLGGNISRSPGPLMVDVTAIGTVRRRQVLRRSGARPGDAVYVTGTVGDAAVGLRSLQERADLSASAEGYGGTSPKREREGGKVRPYNNNVGADLEVGPCEHRYLRPDPRVRAGVLLGGNGAATACMDLSDGLADAVRQVADASGVGITIDVATLPISDCVRQWHEAQGRDPFEAALVGGDDYELMFTVRPSHRGRLRGVQRLLGELRITQVGVVTKDRRLLVRTPQGDRQLPQGFEHFT
jgi:thiamine-monophosphate kinase